MHNETGCVGDLRNFPRFWREFVCRKAQHQPHNTTGNRKCCNTHQQHADTPEEAECCKQHTIGK